MVSLRLEERVGGCLSMMSVFCMNVGFERRGSRKLFAHAPATVTEVSCLSLAEILSIHELIEDVETYSYSE